MIANPTLFEAKPLLRIYGTGQLQIGTGLLTIDTAGTEYIDIDCDVMDCYEGFANRNGNVTISKWPTFTPGNNIIAFPNDSNITQVYITPRWWTL